MSNYKRILVPVDFSEVSKHAAKRAVELAGFYQAHLIFIHVIEHFPDHLPHYQMSGEDMGPEEFLIKRSGEDLKKLCSSLGKDDAEHVVKLTKHSAKAEVLEFAKDNQIDLIVLGSRGQHRLTEWLAGSTATGVVRAAACDVLTVHGSN